MAYLIAGKTNPADAATPSDGYLTLLASTTGKLVTKDDDGALQEYASTSETTIVVNSYSQLRSQTAGKILINDPYLGGLFVTSPDQSTAADDGVRILRNDGVFMDRVWDKTNVNIDWYISSTVPIDLAFSRACALQDSITIYGTRPSYVVRKTPTLSAKKSTLRGMNLTRSNEVFSTLTAIASAGATALQVANGALFQVGDYVAVTTDVRQGFQSGGNFVSAVNGNTLTISPLVLGASIVSNYPVGAKVVVTQSLVAVSVSCETLTIEHCIFDGNSAGNPMRQWQFNPSVSIAAGMEGAISIRNCGFVNTPGENIFAPNGVVISNCTFSSLQGSFVHLSDSDSIGSEPRVTRIDNVVGNQCCLSSRISGHSESFVTFSANVYNAVIENCEVDTCLGDIAGPLNSPPIPSNRLQIRNNLFRNFDGILRAALVNHRFVGLRIDGNSFAQCGDIVIQATSVYRGLCSLATKITDNEFVDSRVRFDHTADLDLSGNTFRFTELLNATTNTGSTWTQTSKRKQNGDLVFLANHGGALPTGFSSATTYYVVLANETTFSLATSVGGSAISGSGGSGTHYCWTTPTNQSAAAADRGAVTLFNYDRARINNNTIEAPRAYNPFLEHAIYLVRPTVRRRNAAGTQQNVLYPQGVRVNYNTLSGFRQGISIDKSTSVAWAWPFFDWQITGNSVWGPWDVANTPAGTESWAIHYPPGSIGSANVHGSFYVNNSFWPGVVSGLSTTSTVRNSSLGAIVDGYWIIAPNASFTRGFVIGSTQATAENTHSVIVRNGYSTALQVHTNNGSANNSVVDPVMINSSLIASFVATGNIPGGLLEYTSQYTE